MTGPSAGAVTVGTMITRLAAARSEGMSWSSEAARPHRTEAAVNRPTATRNVRLVPTRSPIHPDAGMKTARLSR